MKYITYNEMCIMPRLLLSVMYILPVYRYIYECAGNQDFVDKQFTFRYSQQSI